MGSRREQIVRVLTEVVAPMIRADAGALYLVEATDDCVTLHLAGRYAGCPGNTLARRRVIEPAILAVAPGVEVKITAGVLIPPGARALEAPSQP
jgi:Fe-S cluster biogenesis protein NfuA